MRAVVHFVQDNAMFYKDITQWLRNRTFASLFFGLLLVAETLSLFIIAGSDEISNPGTSMFYTLFLVLIIYAMLIAYLGNALTSREFVNRTFELYELSGMSLERMVGGKVLSMLYQFFFGFFCLVPFMFFAYFLGGLDFLEMLVGVIMICVFALPLYLASLMGALTGRFKQINLLTRLASVFVLGWLVVVAFASFFAREPLMQDMVREVTDQMKQMFNGSFPALLGFIMFWLVYVQVCLLMFYFCCDSISRETDSREIPIKVLLATLIVTWMAIFAARINYAGYSKGDGYMMTVPVFLALLALGVRTFYNRVGVPPIVARRYRGATGFRALFFGLFKPGIQGSVRTLFFTIALAVITGTLAVGLDGPRTIGMWGITGVGAGEWWSGFSLLVQIPWFLAIPHVMFARHGDMRYNYPAQRTLAITSWVVVGALVLIYLAWTQSRIYRSTNYGSDYLAGGMEVLLVTLLSPLPSMSVVGSDDAMVQEVGGFVRFVSGAVGALLVFNHMKKVQADEALNKSEAEGFAAEGITSYAVSAPEESGEDLIPADAGEKAPGEQ